MIAQTVTKELSLRRPSFAEQAGFKDLSDISHLNEQDLVEMCTLYPGPMAQLIIELAGQFRSLTARLALKERKEQKDKEASNVSTT